MQLQFVLLNSFDMKTNIIKSTGILFLGLLMATAVDAQPARQGGRGNGYYGNGTGREMQRTRLELTDEQQEQINALRTEHYKAVTPLRYKLAELKAGERTLLSEEDVDMKAVNKNIDEQTEVAPIRSTERESARRRPRSPAARTRSSRPSRSSP